MNNSTLDANIPTLTEVISNTPIASAAPKVAIEIAEEGGEVSAIALSEHDRNELEHTLNERVLRQVQGRIDFVLEHRIRDSLADALQISIDGLTAEIKRGLQQTLEDVISRAVSQELARLQSKQK